MRKHLDNIHSSSKTEAPTGWTVVYDIGDGPEVTEIDYDPASLENKLALVGAIEKSVFDKVIGDPEVLFIFKNRHSETLLKVMLMLNHNTDMRLWVEAFKHVPILRDDLFHQGMITVDTVSWDIGEEGRKLLMERLREDVGIRGNTGSGILSQFETKTIRE